MEEKSICEVEGCRLLLCSSPPGTFRLEFDTLQVSCFSFSFVHYVYAGAPLSGSRSVVMIGPSNDDPLRFHVTNSQSLVDARHTRPFIYIHRLCEAAMAHGIIMGSIQFQGLGLPQGINI